MKIPNSMVGIVIGKGGESITKLMAQSGANMQIEKEHEMMPGETMRKISLRGRQENCEDLKRRVEDVVANQQAKDSGRIGGTQPGGGSNATKEQNFPFIMKAPVPNDRVGIIIGRQGATIKMIQDRTQTNIQIPQVPDADNPSTRTLSIGGYSKEAIDAAQTEIFNQLQAYQQNGGQAPRPQQAATGNTMYIHVADDRVGLIIGKSGATIKEIQNRNSIRIQIPTQADPGTYPPMRSVSLQGSFESQQATKYEIESLLNLAPGSLMQVPGPGAAAGHGQQQPYGAQGYAAQAGAAYGAQYGQTGYGQTAYGAQQAAYGQAAYGASAQATTTTPVAGATPAADAYYEDFWKYVDYYGEEAARAYYQTWAPPVGTPRPVAGVESTATAAGPAGTEPIDAVGANVTSGTTPAPASSSDGDGAVVVADNGKSEDPLAGGVPDEKSTVEGAASESAGGEGADEAWEAYKKQVGGLYATIGGPIE